MLSALLALALGLGSGLLIIAAARHALLGWLMLAPLCAAIYLLPPPLAGLAGVVTGALSVIPNNWGRLTPAIEKILLVPNGIVWGAASALAAWTWPDGDPGWGVLIFPLSIVAALAIPLLTGAPRFGANPTLRSQEGWLAVVHIARLGHDLFVTAALAMSATIPATLLVQLPPSTSTLLSVTLAAATIAATLAFGWASYRKAVRRAESGSRLCVAAVAIAGNRIRISDPATSADVDWTVNAYDPLVAKASAERARLIVIPEVAVAVTARTRAQWLDAISRWARQGACIVVAGLIDRDLQKNQLVMASETGEISVTYDKQHPVQGAEAKREVRMPPAVLASGGICVSGVICVDLDYSDLIGPVSRAGGVLAAPSNDWQLLADIHHAAAVWPVVMTGVPLVRATANGTSAIFDAAGRVLKRASAFDGPVVVVAEVAIPTA